jgi:hypothetical protein
MGASDNISWEEESSGASSGQYICKYSFIPTRYTSFAWKIENIPSSNTVSGVIYPSLSSSAVS